MPWNVIKRLGAGIDTPVILCFLQGPKWLLLPAIILGCYFVLIVLLKVLNRKKQSVITDFSRVFIFIRINYYTV